MLLVVLLVAVFVSLSSHVAAVVYPSNMCYAALWNDGGNVKQQFPLRRNGVSAINYYSYNSPNGSSANTPDRLEVRNAVNYFFYESGTELSMFFIFDIPNDVDGGSVQADVVSTGLAGKGLVTSVQDDVGDGSIFDAAKGTGTIDTSWSPCCTDGMVISKLPRPPTQTVGNFNPADYTWCLNLKFKSSTGVTKYLVRSMKDYFENGATIGMFGANLVTTEIAPTAANSLKMCYTQCECSTNEKLTSTKGFFNSHEVVFGPTGGLNLYRPGEFCSWILNFTQVSGISFFWSEFKMANNAGDIVSFYFDTTTAGPKADLVFPRSSDTRDWTSKIAASSTPYINTAPFTYNSFRTPAKQTTFSKVFASFTSAVDSPAAQPGFQLYYIVIPLVDSISKTVLITGGAETITVTGYSFLSSTTGALKCGWRWSVSSGVAPAITVSDATYVSANQVTCKTPAFVSGRLSDLFLSISNDGGNYWSNEKMATYQICGDKRAVGKESCDDGNTVSGDGCSSSCLVELGWLCVGNATSCSPICGDGIIAGKETCDDKNNKTGDGCSANCTKEDGFVCTGTPSTCTIVCGDGFKRLTEACDDGNKNSGDGCSSTCTIEPGFTCTTEGKPCTDINECTAYGCLPDPYKNIVCRDSTSAGTPKVPSNTRVCDCGSTGYITGTDPYKVPRTTTVSLVAAATFVGCTPVEECKVYGCKGFTCKDSGGSTTSSIPIGSRVCTCDPGFMVTGKTKGTTTVTLVGPAEFSGCSPICGDGIIVKGEECDDGDGLWDGDGCSSTCKIEKGADCTTAGLKCCLPLPNPPTEPVKCWNGYWVPIGQKRDD